MKNTTLVIFLIIMLIGSCASISPAEDNKNNSDETGSGLTLTVADFTTSPSPPYYVGQELTFTSNVNNADSYAWDFDGGGDDAWGKTVTWIYDSPYKEDIKHSTRGPDDDHHKFIFVGPDGFDLMLTIDTTIDIINFLIKWAVSPNMRYAMELIVTFVPWLMDNI